MRLNTTDFLRKAQHPLLLGVGSFPLAMLLTLSFAGAQKDAGLLMQEARDTAKYIQSHGGEDFTLRVYGLTVSSVTTIGGGRRTVDFLITR